MQIFIYTTARCSIISGIKYTATASYYGQNISGCCIYEFPHKTSLLAQNCVLINKKSDTSLCVKKSIKVFLYLSELKQVCFLPCSLHTNNYFD